jgi:hypothetical protein
MMFTVYVGNGYNPQRLIEQTKMGAAGYDPEEPDMRGILLAKGPGNTSLIEHTTCQGTR